MAIRSGDEATEMCSISEEARSRLNAILTVSVRALPLLYFLPSLFSVPCASVLLSMFYHAIHWFMWMLILSAAFRRPSYGVLRRVSRFPPTRLACCGRTFSWSLLLAITCPIYAWTELRTARLVWLRRWVCAR